MIKIKILKKNRTSEEWIPEKIIMAANKAAKRAIDRSFNKEDLYKPDNEDRISKTQGEAYGYHDQNDGR